MKTKYKIVLNEDKELLEEINNALKDNIDKYGKPYCPCSTIHTDDYVCMCKNFKDDETMLECHCGKFKRVIE